jgi:hypothetical protein
MIFFNLRRLIILFFITFSVQTLGQTTTVDYDWGATTGKLTKTVKLVDGKRILDGPLSYTGKDNSPSTMTVKTNYKNGLFEGAFSMNWVCNSTDGFTFNAQGKFLHDSLDGNWTFIVKGYDQGVKINKKITLTFSHGILIQGDINDLIAKSQTKFNCDKTGNMHGNCFWKRYEDGYLIEEKKTFVRGIPTSYYKKDIASGAYIEKPKLLCDTSFINEKHYSSEFRHFSKGDEIFELKNPKVNYNYLFTDRSYLGQFEQKSYGGGFAPFIRTENIILPKEFELVIKKP